MWHNLTKVASVEHASTIIPKLILGKWSESWSCEIYLTPFQSQTESTQTLRKRFSPFGKCYFSSHNNTNHDLACLYFNSFKLHPCHIPIKMLCHSDSACYSWYRNIGNLAITQQQAHRTHDNYCEMKRHPKYLLPTYFFTMNQPKFKPPEAFGLLHACTNQSISQFKSTTSNAQRQLRPTKLSCSSRQWLCP